MKFIDLFAGIGGFRLGMEQAGHECVAFCEIDKFARSSYKAIHNTEGEVEWHDITKVTNDDFRKFRGEVDVICGGFPCQAFSVAGRREGFNDTRGTLFFEIARAVEQIKPRYVFLENVKGLLNHERGETMRTILGVLDVLGYDAEWQVLNSKNFGVPQNRERVFIIGHLRGTSGREVFPIRTDATASNIETLGSTKQVGQREPKVLVKEATKKGFALAQEGDSINFAVPGSKTRRGRVGKGVANTLDTSCNQGVLVNEVKRIAKKTRPNEEIGITVKENGDIRPHRMDARKSGLSELNINHEDNASHTVTSAHAPKVYGDSTNYRIRKLTPRECWRLQGFPDWAFDKAQAVNSNSQLYKQAGNSVTVNVIREIAKKLK